MRFVWIALAAYFVSATTVSAAAHRDELWSGTWLGMSVAEAKRVVDNWFVPAPGTGDETADTDPLLAQQFEIADHKAMATLGFRSGRLAGVAIDIPIGHDDRDNWNLAERLAEMLSRKYGPADHCAPKTDSESGLNELDCAWVHGGVQVDLSYFHLRDVTDRLDIGYGPVRTSGADKL